MSPGWLSLIKVTYQTNTNRMFVPVISAVSIRATMGAGPLLPPAVSYFNESIWFTIAVSEDAVVNDKLITEPVPADGFMVLVLVCGTTIRSC